MNTYEQADNHRKTKEYGLAIPLFKELWESEPSEKIGWRYIYCLRKSKQLEKARQISINILEKFPNDDFTIKEIGRLFKELELYADAAKMFDKAWLVKPDEFIIECYLTCLRKSGRLDDAESIAKEWLLNNPNDDSTKQSLGWVIYDKYLKPAKENSDLDEIIKVAHQIMGLCSNELLIAKTILAVIKVSKDQNNVKWATIAEWTNKVSPQIFEYEKSSLAGKHQMADREIFYIGRSRAFLETNKPKQALQFAQEGLQEYSYSLFLLRLEALAYSELGDIQSAISKMRPLIMRKNCDWYIKAELAELEHSVNNHVEAYKLMCDAMISNRQGFEFVVGSLVTLASISIALNKIDVASAHLKLAHIIRENKGWRMPTRLQEIEKKISSLLAQSGSIYDSLPQSEDELKKICKKCWQENSGKHQQRAKGKILPPRDGVDFTFISIQESGEKIYVKLKNLPRNYKEGMIVEFSVKPSFDRKRNQESVEAIDIQLAY